MTIRNWWTKSVRNTMAGKPGRTARRLAVHQMEDRITPAFYTPAPVAYAPVTLTAPTTVLAGRDDGAFTVPLGANTFNFYGTTYTSVSFSTNGLVTFGGENTNFGNNDLSNRPQDTLAPFWDDQVTFGAGEGVSYEFSANKLVIQWDTEGFTSSPSRAKYQAVLQLNTGVFGGSIGLNYIDVDFGDGRTNGALATIGVTRAFQGPDRDVYLQDGSGPLATGTGAFARDPLTSGTSYLLSTLPAPSFSFETGLTPWVTAAGSVATAETNLGGSYFPVNGGQFGRLSTEGATTDIPGGFANSGSELTQAFNLVAPGTVSIAYNFATNEQINTVTFPDFATIEVLDSTNTVVSTLANVAPANTKVAGGLFANETGWTVGTSSALAAGVYTLRARVTNVGGNAIESTLFLDDAIQNADHGDAPATYGDASANPAGPRLGATRNAEAAAAFSANATGDAGDDGSTFGPLAPGGTGALTVDVQNLGGGDTAYVTAWIDFDNSGTFSKAERIVANQPTTVAGSQVIGFPIPVTAATGNHIARVRIAGTFSGATGYTGSGEVEDQQVNFSTPTVVYVDPSFFTAGAAVDGDHSVAGVQAATVGYDAFDTITQALAVVGSGGTVIVNGNGGVTKYQETFGLEADKPVSLIGVQTPTVIADGAAIAADPNYDFVHVSASNVTVTGFTFDGQYDPNTGLGARRGVTNVADDGTTVTLVNNLTVTNNTFVNLGGRGVSVSNVDVNTNASQGVTTGGVISNNKFSAYGQDNQGNEAYAIYLGFDAYFDVNTNVIDVPASLAAQGFQSTFGIYAIGYGAAGNQLNLNANNITVGSVGTGIYVVGQAGGATLVSANVVRGGATAGPGEDAWGIGIDNVSGGTVAVTGNNVVTGAKLLQYGIEAFNVGTGLVTVTGGTVGGSINGLFVTASSFSDPVNGTSQSVAVNGTSFVTTAGGTGVTVDDSQTVNGALTSVTATGVTTSGLGTGVTVNGKEASLTVLTSTLGGAGSAGGTLAGSLTLTDTVVTAAGAVNFGGAGSTFNVTAKTAANDDTFDIPGTSIAYNKGSAIAFTGLETLNVTGNAGNDYFTVSPNPAPDKTTFNIAGGAPTIVTPGDTLDLNIFGLIAPNVPNPGLPDGTLTSTSHGTVNWVSIESLPIPIGLGGSFDFENPTSATQVGWRQALATDTTTKGKWAAASTGWTVPHLGYDRKDNPSVPAPAVPAGTLSDLLIDGNWDGDGTPYQGEFQVAVSKTENTQFTLGIGDTYFIRDSIEVYVEGKLFGTYATGTGEFAAITGVVAPPADGFLNIVIRDAGGHSYWTTPYLDVRPVTLVNELKLAGGLTAVAADGTTKTTYTGTGARPNALVTINSTAGTVLGDVAAGFQGVQVQADAAGNFSFQIQSPLSPSDLNGANKGVISAIEPTGFSKSKTDFTQDYTGIGFGGRYDFNGAGKLTVAGYTGVANSQVYTTAAGFGWQASPLAYERTAASVTALGVPAALTTLYQDGAYNNGAAGKFFVTVAKGATVGVRAYVGDSYAKWNGVTVSVEGNAVGKVADTATNQFTFVELQGTDADNDGKFWVNVAATGGNTLWVLSALDIASGGTASLPAIIVPYPAPVTLPARYDFNGTSNTTAGGFVSVAANALYNPTTGYGWNTAVTSFERTAASLAKLGVPASQIPLYQDGAAANSSVGKFQVNVAKGATVGLRVYVGDSASAYANIVITPEGQAPQTVSTTASKMFTFATTDATDANGDGIVWVTVQKQGGGVWVANGVDVAAGGVGSLPALPLTAAGLTAPVAGPAAPKLTAATLAPVVTAAIARWETSGLLTVEQVAALRAAVVTVADLNAAGHYGEQAGSHITIDDDAVGTGWFIDVTPGRDEEFVGTRTGTQLLARPGSAAARRVDLFTVVSHELGHVAGFIDLDATTRPGELMTENFGVGFRRLPTAASARTGAFWGPVLPPSATIAPFARRADATDTDGRFGPFVG